MANKSKEKLFYNNKLSLKKRIGITTGDPKGIGKIIVQQSLKKLGAQKNRQFIIWTDKKSFHIPGFKTKAYSNSRKALSAPFSSDEILLVHSKKNVGTWVEEASHLCLNNRLSALVTAPASKPLIRKNKKKAKGHTDLFKQICKTDRIFMTFLGSKFNVILLTDHVPYSKVKISKSKLEFLIKKALELRASLKPSLQKKPLGLLGLNPHAGENGLLGKEELELYALLKKFGPCLEGPLVPDVAFLEKNWSRYSFFISLYHDQGLIPFKMIHKHKGFALSLGLPFIRTGTDHGTGFNLKPNQIQSDSFYKALKHSLALVKKF